MIYNLKNEYERQTFKEKVTELYQSRCIVELKKKNPQRSLAQNRYLYLILGWFSCSSGYSLDEVKIMFFKKLCNKELFERKRINQRGVEVTYLRSSADLTTAEMTTAIERFRNYSAANGLYLPAPNETEFLFHIEKEIERNKEFI